MADVLNCKRCGGAILPTGYCSQCGLKSEYVNKALNTSKYYYNVGLDKARVRDMTGAEDALLTALKYDKMNIDARNLLGLVYYETGQTVTALSHWVISLNHFSGRNVAKRYIQEVKSSAHKLEQTDNVARKYNQALTYATQGSKDLAFIQLRKVLKENPKFVDGYLLLSLLFIDDGKYDKARKALKRVIKIDRTNPLAVRYFNEMGHTSEEIMAYRDYPDEDFDTEALFIEDEPKAYIDNSPFIMPEKDDAIPVGKYKDINFNKYSLAYVIMGLVLGIAIMAFLVVPHLNKNGSNDARKLRISFSEEISDKNVQIETLQNDVDSLNTQVTDLTNQVSSYKQIEASTLSGSDLTTMQKGVKLYGLGNYDDAINEFDIVLGDSPTYDGALYFKALCYKALGEEEKYQEVFNNLVDNCSDSIFLRSAKSYLGQNDDDVPDEEDTTALDDNQ